MYRNNHVIEYYVTVHIIYKQKCDDFDLISFTERNVVYNITNLVKYYKCVRLQYRLFIIIRICLKLVLMTAILNLS